MHVRYPTKLVSSVISTGIVGVVNSLFITGASAWYAQLSKPPFAPALSTLALVWVLLLFLSGIGVSLVWKPGFRYKAVRHALWIFGAQLILSVTWPVLFFAWFDPNAALVELIVLWGFLLVTIIAFWRVVRIAAWLLIPYLVWVTFLLYLNIGVTILNFALW